MTSTMASSSNGKKMQHYWFMRLLIVTLCSLGVVGFITTATFAPKLSVNVNSELSVRASVFLLAKNEPDEEEEDDDEDIDLSDQDWRAFRAKLVMQKPESTPAAEALEDEGDLDGIGSVFSTTSTEEEVKTSSPTLTPLDPSQWAYDSGNVIEKGAVILGGVEQSYGFGLRQQYFHKAAILVLDHDEATFTKGIILNRPSDLTLDDDMNEGSKWRIWFGGDVQGLGSLNPEIVCLHSLKNEAVTNASVPVMKDIQVSLAYTCAAIVYLCVCSQC